MGDTKFAGERLRNLLNFLVATVVVGHHQMSRERGFRRAEWPDVKVMNLSDLRPRLEKGLHFLWINRSWYRIQGEINRFSEQPPSAPEDNNGYRQAQDRIDPGPVSI